MFLQHWKSALETAAGLPAIVVALAACDLGPPAPQAAARPVQQPPPAEVGVASFYGREFAGRTTASGEPYEPSAMTAASRSLPLGTRARVTNHKTGRSVTVKVNDRGPYAKHRILDVSRKAAVRLGMKHDGVARVTVQPVPPTAPDSHAAR